jgi:hypothetical protein
MPTAIQRHYLSLLYYYVHIIESIFMCAVQESNRAPYVRSGRHLLYLWNSLYSNRKVSRFRNVSTIHFVRKSKRLTEKKDNAKAGAKLSTEPEAVVPPATPIAEQTAPLSAEQSSEQPTSATKPRRKQRAMNTAEILRRSEVLRVQSR